MTKRTTKARVLVGTCSECGRWSVLAYAYEPLDEQPDRCALCDARRLVQKGEALLDGARALSPDIVPARFVEDMAEALDTFRKTVGAAERAMYGTPRGDNADDSADGADNGDG